MAKPTILDMALAVGRMAVEQQELIAAVDRGEAILPSARDIRAGGIDYRWQAKCLEAASADLMATARLISGTTEFITRRKAG